ncbi:unnamed protein product [Gadus morhua 'NCC']
MPPTGGQHESSQHPLEFKDLGSVLQSGTTIGTKPPELKKEGPRGGFQSSRDQWNDSRRTRRVNRATLLPSRGSLEERVGQQS